MSKPASLLVFGRPQQAAALMLLCFALACGWLISHRPLSQAEQDHVWSGREQLEYGAEPHLYGYSPLTNILAAAPMALDARHLDSNNAQQQAVSRERLQTEVHRLRWIVRLPFLLAALLFAASIWYIARRLYGNYGGYTALALFCLSPAMVVTGSTVNPALLSAWGTFGLVFIAIAISHNLYAPWKKWRFRTLLLSVSIAMAVASHPATILLIALAFAFMLYLAPGRRWAAFLVLLLAVLAAAVMVHIAYGLSPRALMNGIDLRDWLAYQPSASERAFFSRDNFLLRFPPSTIFLVFAAMGVFAAWRRTRYFGNSAPLICGAALLYFALITPVTAFASIWALPFLFVFIGGIWADLLESRHAKPALAVLLVLLAENAWITWRVIAGHGV